MNRLTNMVDAAGTNKYTYYAGGLLRTEGGLWANDTVTNYYNAARMRVGLGLAQPTGAWTNGFSYDGGHRLSTVISPAGTFTYSYKGPGNLVTNLALPNGSRITNAFDSVGRLASTRLLTSGNSLLDSYAYLYNYARQRTNLIRTDNSVVTNTYDDIGQLQSARGSGGYSTENLGYLYDTAWNLNKRTNNGAPTTFNVNVKNELTSVGGTSYTYDYNGNLSTAGSVYYSYDDENQLLHVLLWNTWKTEFVHDGRGRLRVRKDYVWMGSGWYPNGETRYVYDGMRVIQERNSSNVPTVAYTRGNDLSGSLEGAGGIGGLLARSHGYSGGAFGTHNCYHADGNGNVTYLVNSAQAMVANYRYDPYGNLRYTYDSLPSGGNRYRFSSKEQMPSSGLYYYGYRFYDPNLQRWLSRDPIGEGGGINLYEFVVNDPINAVDFLGLDIVVDPTASDEFRKRWESCLCELQKSRTGKALYDFLNNNKKITVTIAPAGSQTPPGEVPGTGGTKKAPHIGLDPHDPLGIHPDNPWRKNFPSEVPKSCAVVLAHELGHAAGEVDPTAETPRGRNVRKWENPIRLELGEDPRLSYHGWPVKDPRKPKPK